MLMEARYPVFSKSAFVPRHKTPKSVIHFEKTMVDVPEYQNDDIPIAMTANMLHLGKDVGDHRTFRYLEGHFFEPIGEPDGMNAADFEKRVFSDPLVRQRHMIRSLRRQIAAAVAHGEQTYPEGITLFGASDSISLADFRRFFEGPGSRIVPVDGSEKDLEAARDAFLTDAESFVMIDGRVWGRVPEPLLSLNVGTRPGRIQIFCDDLPTHISERIFKKRPDLDEVLFTVHDFDEVRSESSRLFDPSAPWKTDDFVLHLPMPEVFSAVVPHGDVVGMIHRARSDGKIPREVARFCDELWADGAEPDEDTCDAIIDATLDALPENQRWPILAFVWQRQRRDRRTIPLIAPDPCIHGM